MIERLDLSGFEDSLNHSVFLRERKSEAPLNDAAPFILVLSQRPRVLAVTRVNAPMPRAARCAA